MEQLPKPPHEETLPQPHDMLLRKPHFTELHPWVHWVPAIVGLFIGMMVGSMFIDDTNKQQQEVKQAIVKAAFPSPTIMACPTNHMAPSMLPTQSLTPGFGGGIICTQDAKQCPDGSYVNRIGSKCSFAECRPVP